jgi:hypothetical protein
MRNVFNVLISSFFILTLNTAWADKVEVALAKNLGDTSNTNYCIDMPGGQERADPTRDLRAYTCYTDQGFVGFDHAMDSEAIAKGQFHMTGFDVCMQAKGTVVGSAIAARDCDESNALQNFYLRADMTIHLASEDKLCLTVGDEVSYGRNGPGGHEIRDITLQLCSDDRASHQQWVLRDSVD